MTENSKTFNNNEEVASKSAKIERKPTNGSRPFRRDFKIRESIITDLLEKDSNVQAVFAFAASLVWFYILIHLLFNRQQLSDDMSFIRWALFHNFHLIMIMWLELFSANLLVYPITKLYIKRQISGMMYTILLLGLFVVSHIFMHHPSLSWKHHVTNIGLFALINEQMRLILKSLAFASNARDKVNDLDISKEPSICSFSHFLYFHFVPVLLYRDFYPRSTARIKWKRILTLSIHFLGTIYISCVTVRHLVIPHFSRIGKESFSMSEIGYLILTGYWTGVMLQFSVGYGFFHCWMNIWAELLKFGDRRFYYDWWTVTNSADFFRKWNLIVGDFIFECGYLPLMAVTKNRYISGLVVYIISAIIHDYGIYGLLGFFIPFYTCAFPFLALFGDAPVLLKKKLGIFRNASQVITNTIYFMTAYFSFATWVGVLYLESYARKNCPETLDGSWREAFGLSLKFPQCINIID